MSGGVSLTLGVDKANLIQRIQSVYSAKGVVDKTPIADIISSSSVDLAKVSMNEKQFQTYIDAQSLERSLVEIESSLRSRSLA